jgi:DNA-binding NarL/FixJ family response regulator
MAILIVDPCTESRQAAIDVIKWADGRRTVAVAESAAIAWNVALEERPDLVFCEPVLPDMNGETLCSKLREKLPASLFVAYTGDTRIQVEYCSYDGILHKPASKLAILPHLHAARVRRKAQPSPINLPDHSVAERSNAWRKNIEESKPCKIIVSMAEENELKFSLPVPQQATVDAVLRQLGKQSVLSFTLFRNRAPIPTELSTCVTDGDELCIQTAAS